MFESLSGFFKDKMAPMESQADDLNHLQVATCALLLETAHADSDFSDQERTAISKMLGRRFKLDDQQTDELVALAEQERQETNSLFEFARLIDENFPRERKLAIVQLLWQVVYQDGILEAHEDALMHKLGTLLGIAHEELMALKIQVKRSLSEE